MGLYLRRVATQPFVHHFPPKNQVRRAKRVCPSAPTSAGQSTIRVGSILVVIQSAELTSCTRIDRRLWLARSLEVGLVLSICLADRRWRRRVLVSWKLLIALLGGVLLRLLGVAVHLLLLSIVSAIAVDGWSARSGAGEDVFAHHRLTTWKTEAADSLLLLRRRGTVDADMSAAGCSCQGRPGLTY
ncbi:hypothetical protein KC357_g265 [Hortaea werneckii]|nr:hypothetical protein KC357_g265 [Hortaea werneckii]